MDDFSILIGGKAGFGIDKSSLVIANILSRLGYFIYILRDYPSIIRGGHTFSIVRASNKKIACHKNRIDVLLGLNQNTIDFHKDKLSAESIVIYDSDSVKPESVPNVKSKTPLPISDIISKENAPEIVRNTCMIGAMLKALGIKWDILDELIRKKFSKETEVNLKVARRGYDAASEFVKIVPISNEEPWPICTGNEATGLGLLKGGLDAYISYPMTPTSPILHSMANFASKTDITVIHPESEIAVILMALGFAYCGKKSAVGTSGGGFCLMTEGLSFSAMAELPVVIILGQRPGPSTGLPTYSSQTELQFALSAGQGEFLRFIVAPGDAEDAYYWSQVALNISWKYQIPSIVMTDKDMGEGTYSFDIDSVRKVKEEKPSLWDGKASDFKRYLDTTNGVSPLAQLPLKNGIVKVNSYEHDESGITTEDPAITRKMQDKRFRKEKYLIQDMNNYDCVKVFGKTSGKEALITWGSNKGVSVEVGERMALRVIQISVISPFPKGQLEKALDGVETLIDIESNMTAQMAGLLKLHGFDVKAKVLKYDGRPFSVEELEARVKEALK